MNRPTFVVVPKHQLDRAHELIDRIRQHHAKQLGVTLSKGECVMFALEHAASLDLSREITSEQPTMETNL